MMFSICFDIVFCFIVKFLTSIFSFLIYLFSYNFNKLFLYFFVKDVIYLAFFISSGMVFQHRLPRKDIVWWPCFLFMRGINSLFITFLVLYVWIVEVGVKYWLKHSGRVPWVNLNINFASSKLNISLNLSNLSL